MNRLTTAAPLLLVTACQVGPDAREIAREETLGVVSHITRECGVGIKDASNVSTLAPDATGLEAVSRYTLDAATKEDEECVESAVKTYNGSATLDGGCEVGYSYPKGWTEVDGGMRMKVSVECLPHYLK